MITKEEEAVLKLLREISSKLDDIVFRLDTGQKPGGRVCEITKSKLLASVLRSEIYDACDGKKRVSEIAEKCKRPQPLISRYLKELKDGGLIKPRRRGKSIFYVKSI